MSTEKLKEKLAEYELKKEELGNNHFTSEIEQELAEYKQVLEKKYADKNADELSKSDANLFLLNELIAESELEDEAKAEMDAAPVSVETQEVKTVV